MIVTPPTLVIYLSITKDVVILDYYFANRLPSIVFEFDGISSINWFGNHFSIDGKAKQGWNFLHRLKQETLNVYLIIRIKNRARLGMVYLNFLKRKRVMANN